MLKGKKVCFQGNMWSERKVFVDRSLLFLYCGNRRGVCIKWDEIPNPISAHYE
ncbi:hypothetical protein MYX76_17180 [Desulfobacterota bacterium AH_259_B03_O07]|nr:hypothetical protein [Desulfobacterota bacterium AH_259_B03_O07]